MTDPGEAAPRVAPPRALLVVDIQSSFAAPEHTPWLAAADRARLERAIDNAAELVGAYRRTGHPVIWIRLVQTPQRPWAASRWLRGLGNDVPWPDEEPCVAGTDGMDWYRLHPEPGEQIVDKRFYSGFLETRLRDVLETLGVSDLAVAGLTTECCILATVYDAVQHGFRVTLVTDASASYDDSDHVAAVRMMTANAARPATGTEAMAAVRDEGG
ncbi:cysteine hydrolase family protein [Rhodococcus sp. NPDC060084]|uniref:cysteine hydrolase family protein n=1 Tax=Rhodococcus sp. NPDC060084 TaxID=3347053 RepID=UPI0036550047